MSSNEVVAEPRRRRTTDDLAIEAAEEEKKDDVPKRRESVLAKTQRFLSEKIATAIEKRGSARIAIFTHPSPDPDAIGSQMGLAWLLRKSHDNIEVDCFYDGHVSHPQNQRRKHGRVSILAMI